MTKQEIFEFLKENLRIEFEISPGWEGTYVSWSYKLKLTNPETEKPEVIDENSGGYHI